MARREKRMYVTLDGRATGRIFAQSAGGEMTDTPRPAPRPDDECKCRCHDEWKWGYCNICIGNHPGLDWSNMPENQLH